MYKIDAFSINSNPAKISQLSVKREWMDETYEKHAYNCFPLALTNRMGFGISFDEDISFIWDGISDSSSNHVKVLSGNKYVNTGRANGTISFNTGIRFKTDENVSMLIMPVPNMFYDGAQCFTTLMSTSFFEGQIPCVWKITRPFQKITIPANKPVAAIIPISINEINNSKIVFKDKANMPTANIDGVKHQAAVKEINEKGLWTNFYKNAVDYNNNTIGKHELKSINLFVEETNE